MNIHTYIKDFYEAFIKEHKAINAAKDSMLSSGYIESHYNDIQPTSDLIYPCNKNYFYKRDSGNTEQNKFKNIHLYSKANKTSKFFDLVNKNPILNLTFPEKDNFKYSNSPDKPKFLQEFCNKYEHLTDLTFASPSTHNNIRFPYKKINLVILDTPRRKSITTNKYFTITVNEEQFKLRDQFNAMYFLGDMSISIFNPYYPNLFVYAARFEFESYSKLIPKAAII
jgi:hypothetical protein